MIAICSMIRKPNNFETWLQYHFSLGIEHIFLRVEDTPELEEVIKFFPDKITVEYSNDSNKYNNYWSQMDRQNNFVNSVIKECLNRNIKWLAHIDSDELIWCENLDLDGIDLNIDCIVVKNYEAVYHTDNLKNSFLETNRFTKPKLAYGNGKSIGRISDKLICKGPHRFSGKSIEIDKSIIVLHFESPNFECWYKKFYEEKSDISDEMLEKIPFEFYKNSIKLVREGNLEKCREYYNKMKVEPYNNSITFKLYWTPLRKEKNSIWTK